MRALGLITARGGSKGIPRKNVAPLCARPLLAYTCDAASASRRLSRVILSTDDEEIATVGRECGVEVPFLRPRELALDDTPNVDVALHTLRWLESEEDWRADVLVLLQPTSPLRTATHVDEALEILASRSDADTIVSVIAVPHRFNPYSILRLEDGRLVNYIDQPVPFDRYHRQSLPRFYARNGPAILAVRTDILTATRSFYGKIVLPYKMGELESIDIDSRLDLWVAELLISRRNTFSSSAPGSNEAS